MTVVTVFQNDFLIAGSHNITVTGQLGGQSTGIFVNFTKSIQPQSIVGIFFFFQQFDFRQTYYCI